MSALEDAVRALIRDEIERAAPGLNRWLQSKTGEKAVNISTVRSEAGKKAWTVKRDRIKLLADFTVAEVRGELERFGIDLPVRHVRDAAVNPHWGRWSLYYRDQLISAVTGPDFISAVLAAHGIDDSEDMPKYRALLASLNAEKFGTLKDGVEVGERFDRLPDIGL